MYPPNQNPSTLDRRASSLSETDNEQDSSLVVNSVNGFLAQTLEVPSLAHPTSLDSYETGSLDHHNSNNNHDTNAITDTAAANDVPVLGFTSASTSELLSSSFLPLHSDFTIPNFNLQAFDDPGNNNNDNTNSIADFPLSAAAAAANDGPVLVFTHQLLLASCCHLPSYLFSPTLRFLLPIYKRLTTLATIIIIIKNHPPKST
jgi:hypothetical protein